MRGDTRLWAGHHTNPQAWHPGRRKLAETVGADIVIDPSQTSPYQSWADVAGKDSDGNEVSPNPLTGRPELRNEVYFECVGVPQAFEDLADPEKHAKILVMESE